ncbi:MAG: DUF1538 domain-containing protein [Bauldia sp.]|nr:DUF1538 domain-containing protein [Bauldia sp.]
MLQLMRDKLLEVVRSVAPILVLACILQATVVHAPAGAFLQFLGGSALVVVGMAVFFVGIELGVLPMGNALGSNLPRRGSLTLIVMVAFVLGFATTIAEPDVLVLAQQVDEISEGAISDQTVRLVLAVGMAAFVALAMARLILGFSMIILLAAIFSLTLILALIAPADLVPLAFDGGSVTTGAVAGPVIIALAVGVSAVLAGRSAISDGFGLLGIASIGPIIAVLVVGMLFW